MASTQTVSPGAHGLAVFAGVVMIIGGAFQALEGLSGIVHDKYLVVAPSTIYAFDVTVWAPRRESAIFWARRAARIAISVSGRMGKKSYSPLL